MKTIPYYEFKFKYGHAGQRFMTEWRMWLLNRWLNKGKYYVRRRYAGPRHDTMKLTCLKKDAKAVRVYFYARQMRRVA